MTYLLESFNVDDIAADRVGTNNPCARHMPLCLLLCRSKSSMLLNLNGLATFGCWHVPYLGGNCLGGIVWRYRGDSEIKNRQR